MRLGIAADHGGFHLKTRLIRLLKAAGHDVVDFGANKPDPYDDYPDIVIPLARAVAQNKVERGLAICGSGVGACVAANKVSGVRAALVTDSFSAHQGVEDDDMNVMCLGGRVTAHALAWDLVQAFIAARFKDNERFRRRIEKISREEGKETETDSYIGIRRIYNTKRQETIIMPNQDPDKKCDIGLIGLGVMGRNFAKNVADHGFSVAGYDLDKEKMQMLMIEKNDQQDLRSGKDIKQFIGLLAKPRAVMLLVPAGEAVDAVIDELSEYLEPDDLIIDSGNSRFTDTDRRIKKAEKNNFLFMGMGMSGGESGARRGPSLMPGGNKQGFDRVSSILKAAAAHVNDEPCVAYLGPGSAGHYVKMVHNGIEYAIMQLISETYDIMKRGLNMSPDELHAVYDRMNEEELNSYLIEITAKIFRHKDDKTAKPLIDLILDEARQKGTGEWTSWDALDLQVPTFNIDVAVMMRDMSAYKDQRQKAARLLKGPNPIFEGNREDIYHQMKNALYAAVIISYAQGMSLLSRASEKYEYGLDLKTVARIWRGGCIIRAALLEDIRSAYNADPNIKNILFDDRLGQAVVAREKDLRYVVSIGTALGLPVPGLMVALSYFDAFRSPWLPANLIMAQRDYFGSHTYSRVDAEGTFHTKWERG